jgi:hypothetical protein
MRRAAGGAEDGARGEVDAVNALPAVGGQTTGVAAGATPIDQ